jgi:hypothetical protein
MPDLLVKHFRVENLVTTVRSSLVVVHPIACISVQQARLLHTMDGERWPCKDNPGWDQTVLQNNQMIDLKVWKGKQGLKNVCK